MSRKQRRAKAKLERQTGKKATAANIDQHLALAKEHLDGERFAECEAICEPLLEKNPKCDQALFLLACCDFLQGRNAESVAKLERAIELNDKVPDYYANMAVAFSAVEGHQKAKELLLKAVALAPDNPNFLHNLASVHCDLREFADSLACYRRALEIDPTFVLSVHSMGKVFLDIGRPKEAVTCFQRVLELEPDHPGTITHIGTSLLQSGDKEGAVKVFRAALEKNPGSPESLFLLSDAGAADENDILQMQHLLENPDMEDEDRVKLQFGLGSAFNRLKRHDEAFEHWNHGNRLERKAIEHDADDYTAYSKSIAETFNADMIARNQGVGVPSDAPIFIVGMPRSGTTLTEQIISSHSRVFGAGELTDFSRMVQKFRHPVNNISRYPQLFADVPPEVFTRLGKRYMEEAPRLVPAGFERFTDKMPGNFKFLGAVHLALPNAKIIHCRRSAMDTCLSIYQKNFSGVHEYAYDLGELGRFWVDYFNLMAHWRTVLPEGTFLDVSYEETVADQEAQTRRILEFCNLPWEDACLEFHTQKRMVKTSSLNQVRNPIYTSSVARWKRFEKHLGPLVDALGEHAENGPEGA